MSMSDWTRVADDAAEVTFGVDARIRLRHLREGHAVAWIEDGVRNVLAIAGGSNSAEAFRTLVQMCYRDDHRPTTQEVAAVLGVDDSRVRQLVQAGAVVPVEPGTEGRAARFEAAVVSQWLNHMRPA